MPAPLPAAEGGHCVPAARHIRVTAMSLDRSDVAKMAHLARLAVCDQELGRYAMDLSRILDLVAQMDTVNTAAVSPMAHPLHML